MAEYSRAQRAMEWASIAALLALLAWGVGRALALPAWQLAAAALVAWLIADFASGLVHWAFDTYGSTGTTFLGPWFIRAFREHHDRPAAMAEHDFVETNGANCIGALPLAGAAALLPESFAQALLSFTAAGVLATNQCHKWAHMQAGPLVRFLQRCRLILHPMQHRRHHAAPHDSHFCTASGWMNGPLEAAHFWRGLERLVRACVPSTRR